MSKDYKRIIEDFSDKKFVYNFLVKHKETLEVVGDPKSLSLKVHYKRCKETGKRLIVTYSFEDNGEQKSLTAKLRNYKGNNFAKKGWVMTSNIWKQLEGKDKFITRPVAYFDDYDLFVYETAKGTPFNKLLEKLEQIEIGEKIYKAAYYLAQFHKINIKKFSKVDFYNEFGVLGQLDIFLDFLKTSKLEYSNDIEEAVRELKAGIKKYSIKDSLIHGDFQIENFIIDGDGFRLIDFDFVEVNDPIADVGNFLVQIFYGGSMGIMTERYRKDFLDIYLKHNSTLDTKNLYKRINLYISAAKARNISNKIMRAGAIGKREVLNIKSDIKRIKRRLKNLDSDPVELFSKPVI